MINHVYSSSVDFTSEMTQKISIGGFNESGQCFTPEVTLGVCEVESLCHLVCLNLGKKSY